MFISVSTTEMREMVLETFKNNNAKLRLLIATATFGVGINFPDIERIIVGSRSSARWQGRKTS